MLVSAIVPPGFSFLPSVDKPVGPQSVLRPLDIVEYGKPKDMINILPGRPIASKDKYGNRLYFAPSGEITLKITPDGTMMFNLNTQAKEYKDGKLLTITEKKKGTNLAVIKNENGEVLGYQEMGLGGKVLKEYDKDMNLVKSFKYDKYGKNVIYMLDENSQIKTLYGENGKPIAEVNYEGTEIARYIYDEKNIIRYKIDITGNKTFYDEKGKMLYTQDLFGNIIMKYYYKKDANGNEILDKSVNYLGNTTYFEDNKAKIIKDKDGNILQEYFYDGSKLIFTFNHNDKLTTWYDIDGKPLYVTYENQKVKEYLYSEGKLVGIWDNTSNTLSVVLHGEEIAKLLLKEKPTGDIIQRWLNEGIIKKEYTSSPFAATESTYKEKVSPMIFNLYLAKDIFYREEKNKVSLGYYNDKDKFVTIQVNYYNKNGLLEKKEDLISGKVQEFDTTGKISCVYTKAILSQSDGSLKEQIFEAKVLYNNDGSYSISYKSLIDKDGDPNTLYDREVLEDAEVEYYSFDGRLIESISRNWVNDKIQVSKNKYIYDSSGFLIKQETYSDDDILLYGSYFKENLEQYKIKYVYDNNGKLLGRYVSSRNFYSGRKILKTEMYELEDITQKSQKVSSTIYYDNHSRISTVVDALGRITQRYFYNDFNKSCSIPIRIKDDNGNIIKHLSVMVKPGGIIYSESYTYYETNIPLNTIRTYYHNGYEKYEAISFLIE